MKHINKKSGKIVPVIAVALLLLIFALSSCEYPRQKTQKSDNCYMLYAGYDNETRRLICSITIDTIQGHEYIIAEKSSGLSIVHAESCACQKATKANESESTIDFNW